MFFLLSTGTSYRYAHTFRSWPVVTAAVQCVWPYVAFQLMIDVDMIGNKFLMEFDSRPIFYFIFRCCSFPFFFSFCLRIRWKATAAACVNRRLWSDHRKKKKKKEKKERNRYPIQRQRWLSLYRDGQIKVGPSDARPYFACRSTIRKKKKKI